MNTDSHKPGLLAGEEHYRVLYECTPMMYFTLDLEGRVQSLNAHGASELGYEAEELVGRPVLDVFLEEDRARVQAGIERVMRTRKQGRWEARKRRKDGAILWVSEIVTMIEYEDGESAVLVVCENITERKLAKERLRGYRQALRRLSLNLALAEERERRRIAIGLHDQVGQTLGLTKLRLKQLRGMEGAEARETLIRELEGLIDSTIHACRSLSFDLSSPALYELGLGPALQELGHQFQEVSSVRFHCDAEPGRMEVSETVAVILHRCVREILRNVAKHAKAKNVWLSLDEDAGNLWLSVEDDGIGMKPKGEQWLRRDGFGIFSMREQLGQIGGNLEISKRDPSGTRISISVPSEEPAPVSDEDDEEPGVEA